MTTALLLFLLADVQAAKPQAAAAAQAIYDPAAEIPKRVGVDVLERKLTVTEAVELAVKNNLDVEIERTHRDSAVQLFEGAKGFLDPVFRWSPSIQTSNTPTSSVLQGANGKLTEHLHTQNLQFAKKFDRNGLNATLDFDNTRNSTSNPFVGLTPYTTSRLGFSLTQPLLRGRKIDRDRTELSIRRKNMDLSAIDFELKLIDVITRTETAYWDLAAARQDVDVKAESVALARDQLARNKRQIDAGTLAPVELSASEAELERRKDTLFAAVETITTAENRLKSLIAPDRAAVIWNEELVPADRKTPAAPAEIYELRQSVEQAIGARAELRAVKLRLDVNDIEKKQNADLIKPQVNLVATYYNSGLGGTARAGDNPFSSGNVALYQRLNQLSASAGLPPIAPADFSGLPDTVVGGYGRTLKNVFGGNYQTALVGLQVDFPFRNTTAKSALANSGIAEKRLKLQLAQSEQIVEAQVRNAIQSIVTARQRVAAAEASSRAAKEKLDSEVRLFQTGESTNFLVLTRQNEFADSRRREVVAQLELNKSVSRWQQALGSTLKDHNVSVK